MNSEENMLEELREDIRKMGPDGTISLGTYLKILYPESGDFVQWEEEPNE